MRINRLMPRVVFIAADNGSFGKRHLLISSKRKEGGVGGGLPAEGAVGEREAWFLAFLWFFNWRVSARWRVRIETNLFSLS
jgi:hypothetical protein